MEIGAVSSALSTVKAYAPSQMGTIPQAASLKMLDNAMEMSEAMNSQMVSMMEQSVMPNLGGNIDLRI